MMMRVLSVLMVVSTILSFSAVEAFSMMSMTAESKPSDISSRRGFFSTTAVVATTSAAIATSILPVSSAVAAGPTIYNLDSSPGLKYAITKEVKTGRFPQQGDIVSIEYTGYLSNGAIFDATHAEGTGKQLVFLLGSSNVNTGINAMVAEMRVGQKVQAIVPPEYAFGDKGTLVTHQDGPNNNNSNNNEGFQSIPKICCSHSPYPFFITLQLYFCCYLNTYIHLFFMF